jgi:diguanylate cyclase
MKPRVAATLPWSLSKQDQAADVRWELRHQLTTLASLAQWTMIPVLLLTLSGLWEDMDRSFLLAWGLLISIQMLAGLNNNRINNKRLQEQNSNDNFVLRNSLYYGMVGLLWGLLPLGAALLGNEQACWFALIIAMAVMTALVLILSTSHRIFYFALGAPGLLSFIALLLGPVYSPQLAALALIYLLALILMHNTLYQVHLDRVHASLRNAAHAAALANTLEHHDAQTGLYNRAGLHRWWQLYPHKTGNYRALTLALGGIKGFSDINLLHGSSVADALLVEIATRLVRKTAGDEHVALARLGGAEFLLVDARPEADAEALVQLFTSLEHEDFVISDRLIHISIQPSTVHGKADDLDLLIEHARSRLLSPRSASCEDSTAFRIRSNLVTSFHYALENEEIQAWFQPIVDCVENRIIGWEALARWQHPEQGTIAPETFIDIARISGQATQLTRSMFRASIRFIKSLVEAGLSDCARVSINFTASDLASVGTLEWMRRHLEDDSQLASHLSIEISEKEALLHDVQLNENLQGIQDLGMKLVIDDFGTGYANISQLLVLPASTVKLDRHFIDKLPHDKQSVALVRAIITMASSMEMSTVAEGVESREQLIFLRDHGCDAYQGFLAGQALPAKDALALARTW